jgi:hypothetical protein
MKELKNKQEEVKEEYQEELQETVEKPKKLEIKNAQEIKDGFLSVEVKNLYGDEFCQYIFDPKTEQNEKLLEALKGVDVKPYVVDIEALKTAKHAELKAQMVAKRDALTCYYDGDEFDCNTNAQNNINSLILFTETSKTDAIVSIRSSNETTHVFNKEQLHELSSLMVKAVNDLYAEYWVLKDNLSKAKCEEDIKSINWS